MDPTEYGNVTVNTTASHHDKRVYKDRFIPHSNQSAVNGALFSQHMKKAVQDASPRTARVLADALDIPLTGRILSFDSPTPSNQTANVARRHSLPAHARPSGLGNASSSSIASVSTTKAGRRLPSRPERVLDAPGLADDFYSNLLSWSAKNMLAVGLGKSIYIWNGQTGSPAALGSVPHDTYIASVDWTADGSCLAVGLGNGKVELWDVSAQKKLRAMICHRTQVGALSWWNYIVSSGCSDGGIFHHDVRATKHRVSELIGHKTEVCGLKWRKDGEMLASGGNDNVVNMWEGRSGGLGNDSNCLTVKPKWTTRDHTAAVKALAWCPWQDSLLATGGGTSDSTLHFWSATTGARLHSLQTHSQISNVVWSPYTREFATTHGYQHNSIMIHEYPTMSKVHEISNTRGARILYAALSPDGTTLVSGVADEKLMFWKLWEVPKKRKRYERTSMDGIDMEMIR